MYKLLLCWRYLRTRYIALVCIISVMLGVGTLIVVNSVMAGFSSELQSRMNDVMGDVILESRSIDGVPDAEAHMRIIKEAAGDKVVGMTPIVELPALMYIDLGGGFITKQVMLLGIDEQSFPTVSNASKFLQHPENRKQLSFALRDGGYDQYDHTIEDPAKIRLRSGMEDAGWEYRRRLAQTKKQLRRLEQRPLEPRPGELANPFNQPTEDDLGPQGREFDPAIDVHHGVILGIATCSWRDGKGVDHFHAKPGSDVRISFPKASLPPEAINEFYTVVDFIESKWIEFDSAFAIVPLQELQRSRGMVDPTTGIAKFTSLRIKVASHSSAEEVRNLLREHFEPRLYALSTWRDKQGPLLAAIQMETVVLNILLFLIIAVAGFGILAIFCMIVVEKTRDIGILKSLGASREGVMGIFLGYGLALGIVGAGTGTVFGLLFVGYINEIADLIGQLTGQPVFDPSVYFLPEIPTIIEPFTICWITLGAVGIAVISSIVPAWRAARLHPVRALRYE